MSLALRATTNGCTLNVRVHPGARRNAITGTHDGALKISLTTPPTDGRANAALIAFLAEMLNIPRARITLTTGATSRTKTLHLEGLTPEALSAALEPSLA
ncbi:MAG TPA: DUF167 domain-containing protein [Acidobacteriaceae bacterium]|jgi:uncharacterized protein (TIGR00251 family)|nr:DUF167 domain-containing protein [Acidobacteriaceae bacterium]